jgi:Peptidase family M23
VIKPTKNWVTQTAAQHGYPATDYSWHISRFNYTPRPGIYAPANGKCVRAVINDGARGKSVDYQVGTVTYEFSHLKDIGVQVGKTYPEGHLIGIMGNTGQAFGVHLHLVIKINGVRVPDPDAWLNAKIAASQVKTVTITAAAANVRTAPNLTATITSTLKKGQTFGSVGLVTGTSVSGNNKWHRTTGNKYVWSGNCNVK